MVLMFMSAEGCAGGYEAKVVRSPAGEGQLSTFARPLTDLELENFVLMVGLFRSTGCLTVTGCHDVVGRPPPFRVVRSRSVARSSLPPGT